MCGIGRALTQVLAEKIGRDERDILAPTARTSLLLLLLLLGVLAAASAAAISPWLVFRALQIPPELRTETLRGFILIAVSIPLMTLTSGLRGILEALQRFKILNLIRIPTSVFSYAGPLLVLPFSHSLVAVFMVLTVGRLIGCLAHLLACFRAMPELQHEFVVKRRMLGPLFRTGSWMTAGNVLALVIMYVDRFIIGAILSVTAVSYYTAPFDMLTRIWIVPWAVVGVLFPVLAGSIKQDPRRAGWLVGRGTKYVFLAVFPIILVLVSLAHEILRVWLGANFAQNGSQVLRWLACGVFMCSLARVPFTAIQSAGRADITAKLVIAELPVYSIVVWWATSHWGIEGTAIAFAGRFALEGAFLFGYASRLVPQGPKLLRRLVIAAAGSMAILYISSLPQNVATKAVFLATSLALFALAGWWWVLNPDRYLFLFGVASETSAKVHTH
jgi:O-antigen/teichoic acid export membrane protein